MFSSNSVEFHWFHLILCLHVYTHVCTCTIWGWICVDSDMHIWVPKLQSLTGAMRGP